MATRGTKVTRMLAAEQRLVVGCVPDPRTRARLQTALRGHATLQWLPTFNDVLGALEGVDRSPTVVVAMTDDKGGLATAIVKEVRERMTGTAVVVCCDLTRDCAALAALAEAGVHHVLFTGVSDEGYAARTAILGAALGAAGDIVMHELGSSIPDAMAPFVDAVVRRPRELRRVNDVAATLLIPRQTLCRWCRNHRYLRPEELMVWARLFLVAALLEITPWTLETIASELKYGAACTLRNRIRDYSGLTSTQLRDGGLELMLSAFARRVSDLRRSTTSASEPRELTRVG